MNRKERRAAGKRRDESARRPNALAFGSAGVSIVDLAAEASRSHAAGRINEAQEICRQILAREPAHVQSLNLLGLIAQASGDHRVAVKMFAKAIASDEVNAACQYNAGNSYQALGDRNKAIAHFSTAMALGMDEKAVTFILQSPIIATYVARIAAKWPLPITNVELFGTESVIPLANDIFLRCAMQARTLPSVQLEMLLGYARAELLRFAGDQGKDGREIGDDIVAFACALARQCFINEYVYTQTETESGLAGALRDRLLQDLSSGAAITPLTLAVVAAYFPLHVLPMAEALLRRAWPASVAGLLQVQLREPLEEAADRAAIAALTPVRNNVSVQVMHQYEENPYPRWTINPLNAFAADQARGRTIPSAERQAELDILIAGAAPAGTRCRSRRSIRTPVCSRSTSALPASPMRAERHASWACAISSMRRPIFWNWVRSAARSIALSRSVCSIILQSRRPGGACWSRCCDRVAGCASVYTAIWRAALSWRPVPTSRRAVIAPQPKTSEGVARTSSARRNTGAC